MRGNPSVRVHPAVQILVLFHVVCITLWSIPLTPPEFAARVQNQDLPPGSPDPGVKYTLSIWNDRYVRPSSIVRKYVFSTGQWQYWDMFAPNPSTNDFWVDSEILLEDGTTVPFAYPRMSSMSIPVRYTKERFRKFIERGHEDKNSVMWPYIARRLALDFYTTQNKRPLKVTLVRHWRFLTGPGQPDPAYNKTPFYTYLVQSGDLEN
jgi:hypothetical protein